MGTFAVMVRARAIALRSDRRSAERPAPPS
jgi:hypothetical protein